MCCDLAITFDARFNRSCCPGVNGINLFTIGSELDTATSITLSSSSAPDTSSSSSPRTSSSNSIIHIDGSSVFALPPTTALSSTNSTSSSFSLSTGFSIETNSATTLESGHSGINGSTIAIASGTSIGAAVLVITSLWIYRRRGRSGRKTHRKQVEAISRLEMVDAPQEMSGKQDHELAASARDLTQELPQPEAHMRNPQELSGYHYYELYASAR